ncbi:hypothetical protein [Kineococcus esterisolvens]|uniref:hypothetical protein n=1 Tax=unclassified Kineococcus TaxID=2621656 RepID=UPI003D7D1DDD
MERDQSRWLTALAHDPSSSQAFHRLVFSDRLLLDNMPVISMPVDHLVFDMTARIAMICG